MLDSGEADTYRYEARNWVLNESVLAEGGECRPLQQGVFRRPNPHGVVSAVAMLYLQPRDMAKIGYLYLHNGVWEGKQLLPPEWVNKVSHPTVETHLKQGFWYSNFFWALPDKHVYMAVGRYGQVIMIFPDLNVVAVTTGHKGYQLSEFADAVSGSVKSDTAIPADAAGEKLLANKILGVSTKKPR
jgi:CubicO group peptidase (beta-lactamase class C family)